MFHGKPLNQSTNTSQQQPQWPLNPQDYNNLRQSQNLSSKNIPVKFYLPDGEIRRSTIDTACNYQRITSFVKQYASVADKEVLLAWFDDQSEWIRFDTESEFTDAMNFARSLLNVPNSVFKILAKVKKDVVLKKKQKPVTTAISQESVPTTQPIQPQPVPQQPIRPTQPVQQPIQPVLQQPQLQPQPVPQKPINQPMQPQIQPQQPINHPYYNPVQPVQSPFQPQFQPMAMNQPPMSMNQPSMVMNQPMPSLRGSPYTTPTKTLNSSVTMQQPHPLNSSFSSPQPTVQQQQQQQQQQQPQQPQQQPTVQQQQPVATNDNNGAFDPTHISFLRDIGFGFDDAVLIKVLKEANGDVSVAAEKLLSYKQ